MQASSWADGLELVGDDDRLVGFVGAVPLRLLAERTGLRAGLSAAMARRGFDPVYDRGQVLIDMAVAQILGAEAISDFQGLRHLAPVIGPVASTPTVWRALSEVGELQRRRVNTAVTSFRRHWWELLADRPEGFPWLKVAGRELTGITVVDLDASVVFAVVFAASDKENAAPTDKGGVGFCPNLATCDTPTTCSRSTRGPAARRRIAPPTISLCSIWRSPGCRAVTGVGCWWGWTGPGSPTSCSTTSPQAPGCGGGTGSSRLGWSCTDRELDAIERVPAGAWTAGIDQNGDTVPDTVVADLTGLLDLDSWHQKIPGLRILVRDEPLHPRYRKRATDREKQLGRRYQLIALNTKVGQIAWLDARHRSHVHVDNDVKQAKDLGLDRWPSRHWSINVAWTQIVALAANLLACFRHLALPAGELRCAAPKLLRYRFFHLPARLTRGQRKRWLHLRADWPWIDDLINTWNAVRAIPAPT